MTSAPNPACAGTTDEVDGEIDLLSPCFGFRGYLLSRSKRLFASPPSQSRLLDASKEPSSRELSRSIDVLLLATFQISPVSGNEGEGDLRRGPISVRADVELELGTTRA